MKNDIENMLLSKDKETIYMAVTMVREQPNMFTLSTKKILNGISLFDKIKSYSDVCKELQEEEKVSPYDKIKQIERLFNGKWKKNWKDKNQYKWFPYFEVSGSSGLVFNSSLIFQFVGFYAAVGFYKDQETSDFVGKTFIDIYRELM